MTTDHLQYRIAIKSGLLNRLPDALQPFHAGQKWIIFTHPGLVDLFAGSVEKTLKNAGFPAQMIMVPEGESSKTIGEVNRLYEQLLQMGCDRSTSFIALGGGVIGDVTGFVASTFMRGVSYFQVPTTLLAMVDSSVGGKTGVNMVQGKNLIGTFYQPTAVYIDPAVLRHLPLREMVSGLGEVLKYGAIASSELFRKTCVNLPQLSSLVAADLLSEIIAESCSIKARIVSEDEKETGLRRILNFGHTIGHALEHSGTRPSLRHGEAVTYGMLCAGYISTRYGSLPQADWQILKDALRQLSIPEIRQLDTESIIDFIQRDKKQIAGTLHFILLEQLGRAVISQDVTTEMMRDSVISTLLPRHY